MKGSERIGKVDDGQVAGNKTRYIAVVVVGLQKCVQQRHALLNAAHLLGVETLLCLVELLLELPIREGFAQFA